MHTHKLIRIPYTLLHYMCMCTYMYVRVYLYRCTNSYFGLCVSSAGSDILTSFFRSMLIRFTVSSRLASPRQRKLCIMFLPLPVSGCGSSPAGEGGRPLSLLPLPVSGLGSSPAGEGGRPISLTLAFSAQSHVVLMPRRTSVFRSMPIRFRTLSWELAEIMLLPLPVSGCGSSPAGEGGRPLSPSLYSLPLPVSGLGSSPAGEGGRPIHVTCQFMLRTTHILHILS